MRNSAGNDLLKNLSFSEQQTYHWLFWLHSKLSQENQSAFLIEFMQPTWLETPQQKYLYQVGVGLITGSLISLIYGMTTGWIGAVIGGLIYGLILGCNQKIYPIGTLKWSIKYAKTQLLFSVIEGLCWGFVYGLIDAVIGELIWGVEGLIWGMIEVLIWGLVEGLIWGISIPTFKSTSISNQAIKESAQNAVIFTGIGGIAWLLIYGIVLKAASQPLEPNALLLDGLSCGLFFGIYIGGLACIQHFVLRLILWWNNCIPWNYAKFLDDATQQGFLEREGGYYRFKHQQWQDYVNAIAVSPTRSPISINNAVSESS